MLAEHYLGCLHNGQPSGQNITPHPDIAWHRLRHTSFGGVTNFTALVGFINCTIDPKVSVLRRTIRHILDYFALVPAHGGSGIKGRV